MAITATQLSRNNNGWKEDTLVQMCVGARVQDMTNQRTRRRPGHASLPASFQSPRDLFCG
jgi:hypothetical protein